MSAIFALISEAMALVPQAISAGLDVAALIEKARAVLDANAAPDDVDWQALDARVSELQKRLNADPA